MAKQGADQDRPQPIKVRPKMKPRWPTGSDFRLVRPLRECPSQADPRGEASASPDPGGMGPHVVASQLCSTKTIIGQSRTHMGGHDRSLTPQHRPEQPRQDPDGSTPHP